MSNIPLGREELYDLADEIAPVCVYGADRIREIIREHLIRVAPVRAKTRAKLPSLTPELAHRLRTVAALYPDWSIQEIAVHCNVNSGRVSEALHFKDRKKQNVS